MTGIGRAIGNGAVSVAAWLEKHDAMPACSPLARAAPFEMTAGAGGSTQHDADPLQGQFQHLAPDHPACLVFHRGRHRRCLWWVLRVSRKPAPSYASAAAATHAAPPSIEGRLQQLAWLRAGNVVCDSEYGQQRSALLRSLREACLPLDPHHPMAACTCAGGGRACCLLAAALIVRMRIFPANGNARGYPTLPTRPCRWRYWQQNVIGSGKTTAWPPFIRRIEKPRSSSGVFINSPDPMSPQRRLRTRRRYR